MRANNKAVMVPYEPKPREKAAVEAWRERRRLRRPSPKLKVTAQEGENATIELDHPDLRTGSILLMDAIGTVSDEFLTPFISQLVQASSTGSIANESALNFMVSVVKSVEPKDEVEAMLAAQMAAVHIATMTFARRLNHVENIPQQDSAERAFNKLTRTFVAQMEGLKRYRTGGEQKVTVQHVTVNEGGQAVVGNVSSQGR